MIRTDFERNRAGIVALHTERHAHLVEGVIRWARPKHVLEIGAFQGYMSVTIARALWEVWQDDSNRLSIIDNFHDYRTNPALLSGNMNACGISNYEVLIGTSETVTPPAIDMAVIDGDHSYEWAWRDTKLAIEAGAWILMWHDSHSYEGVRMAVDHVRSMPNWGVVELPFDAGYALAIERFDAGPAEIPLDKSYTP
jgi:predicted O-methyltransferase YrrM